MASDERLLHNASNSRKTYTQEYSLSRFRLGSLSTPLPPFSLFKLVTACIEPKQYSASPYWQVSPRGFQRQIFSFVLIHYIPRISGVTRNNTCLTIYIFVLCVMSYAKKKKTELNIYCPISEWHWCMYVKALTSSIHVERVTAFLFYLST